MSIRELGEAPVWLSINGKRRILLSCSPVDLPALATGHLLAEGWAREPADVHVLRTVAGPGGSHGVELEIPHERLQAADALLTHRLETGCGVRHALDCETMSRRLPGITPPPDLAAPFRALFAAADAAAPHGVHAAAWCTVDGALHHVSVDVARHCAADRAIGRAALAGMQPVEAGLVLSSRISASLALKAVNAGVGWVASRSIATPLAREIAAAAGVRLIERAARRGA